MLALDLYGHQRSDNVKWASANSSNLYRIVDHTAQEFNRALHWLGVRGCEFANGSGHVAPLVLTDEAACRVTTDGREVWSDKMR